MKPRFRSVSNNLVLALGVLSAVAASDCRGAGDDAKTTDTAMFVPAVVVFLHGERVPQAIQDGATGVVIARRGAQILVGDRVYVDVRTMQPAIDIIMNPEKASPLFLDEVVRQVWHRAQWSEAGELLIDSAVLKDGTSMRFAVQGRDTSVTITREGSDFYLITAEGRVILEADVPPRPDPDAFRQNALQNAYAFLKASVRPGRVVVMGKGYSYTFPLGEEAAISESLAAVARGEYVAPGESPIEAGQYKWGRAVQRDFERSAKGGRQ